jgi:hypothetical protein
LLGAGQVRIPASPGAAARRSDADRGADPLAARRSVRRVRAGRLSNYLVSGTPRQPGRRGAAVPVERDVRRSVVEGGRIELPKSGKIHRVDLSLLLGRTSSGTTRSR